MRYSVGMLQNRIKEWRIKRGLSQQQLADLINTSQPQIQRLENSKRGVDIHWIGLLTTALKCSPAELISTNGVGESHTSYAALRPDNMVAIVGVVGAGGEVVFDEKKPIKHIKTPEEIAQNTIALHVQGDSMEPVFREGDTVILEDVCVSPEQCVGEDAIVRLNDGRTLLKKLLKGNAKSRYNLKSYHPDYPLMVDAKIEWAQRVIWVKRKNTP